MWDTVPILSVAREPGRRWMITHHGLLMQTLPDMQELKLYKYDLWQAYSGEMGVISINRFCSDG